MPKDTIMIQWKNTLFSENLYAWFDCEDGMVPVFATTLHDCMLPENLVIQRHKSGESYEIFAWDNIAQEHLYRGRLFIPSKATPLV
jgi:hypothetical protein